MAITCTPINVPAVIVQGKTFAPAIVNGIDSVSYSMVRFQWTSDASTNPVNAQRIVYATAAQWAANPGVYPSVFPSGGTAVNSNATIQGNTISNLQPNTLYHIAGQSSGDGGSTWCPAVDETFTTLPFTGVAKPTPPTTFDLTEPTVTGTDYTVGVAPCTNLQTCLNLAKPGDGIGIPPGSPVVITNTLSTPLLSTAIPVTVNQAQSKFTASSSSGVTNGMQIHLGGPYYVPSPIESGVTYSVVNASTSGSNTTFQVSLDGTNPVTLADSGIGNEYVIPWPITQNYVIIHSTAPSSSLPPAGVRLDPVAYGSSLGVIELSNVHFGTILQLNQLAAYYWFKNIEFTMAPNAPATETDPIPYGEFFQTTPQTDHIVFDQCYFHAPPAPDRMTQAGQLAGTNQAVINSYFDNIDYWQIYNQLPPSTGNGTMTITVQPGVITWPGPGNTKQTCTISTPQSLTVNSGTSGEGFYLYFTINPCVLTANVQTGLSVTAPGFNVVNSATPAYPVDSSGSRTVLPIGSGTFYGTYIGYADTGILGVFSQYLTEGTLGLQITQGPGPFMFLNNYYASSHIVGIFQDDGNVGVGCPAVTACNMVSNATNLTVQRNTITYDPAYIFSSPKWNGSWWAGRNGPEQKWGRYIRYDGNVIGPIYSGLASGWCYVVFTYASHAPLTQVNYEDSSDQEFSNNTCIQTASQVAIGGGSSGIIPGFPQERNWIHNNLFLLDNGYNLNPMPTTEGNINLGRGIWLSDTESTTIEHNTVYGQGGGDDPSVVLAFAPSAGLKIVNNIFSYATDGPGHSGLAYWNYGSAGPSPGPSANEGSAVLSWLNDVTWMNNVMLGTWSNSNPSSYSELTSSQISAAAALYPGAPQTIFPAGSGLANRKSYLSWIDPDGLKDPVNGYRNFRLKPGNPLSPYISGGSTPASDGLDIGANIDTLEAAQGKVSNVRVPVIGTTTATVEFLAPDTFGCSVDWTTNAWSTFTRVANSGGTRTQSVSLSSLPVNTKVTYRVNCAVMQPTGSFTTQ
jgi:hypothetical protein